MVSPDEFDHANRRAQSRRDAGPTAVAAHYDQRIHRVRVVLNNGLEIAFKPRDVQGLETATLDDLSIIEISPSGLGLHFPKRDADLYLPALLEGLLGSGPWMAARLGAHGGMKRSPAKAAASRKNGQRGGRPRKSVA